MLRTGDQARLFVVVPTHTTRHLRPTLLAIGGGTRKPDAVVLTCDVDSDDIEAEARAAWHTLSAWTSPPPLHVVRRPHTGRPRLNQVRNNGLRALEQLENPDDNDLVIVFDGDTMPAADCLAVHEDALRNGFEVNLAYRVMLGAETTAQCTNEAVASALESGTLEDLVQADVSEQLPGLRERQARYERQLADRSHPLKKHFVKPHKPKALGGHHAVTMGRLRQINGYDELFVDYGFDDDDLTERLYRLSPRVRVAVCVSAAMAYHLDHPTRAPSRPTEAPGYERFAQKRPARCERGFQNPTEQDDPRIVTVTAQRPEEQN